MFGAIPIQPPLHLPCGRCLWPYGVALSSAPWLAAFAVRCQIAAALVPLLLCRGAACSGGAVSGGLRRLLRRAWRSAKVAAKVAGKVSGKVAKVAGIVVRLRAKVAGKVAHFTPKS